MARLYIYRNLRTGGFSLRHKGKVIHRFEQPFIALEVDFKVSEAGRQRVLQKKQKNVHAFVVSNGCSPSTSRTSAELQEIRYNPYLADHFVCDGRPINRTHAVLFENGKAYRLR